MGKDIYRINDGNLTYGLYTSNTGATAISTGGTLAKTSGTFTMSFSFIIADYI